jgi:Enoyl-CoA hydratase/carnithine racemase
MSATDTTSPPELKTMRIEIDDAIGTLTLARPDALNAMSPEMIGELSVAAAWLADLAPLRALVVTGEGRAFSSGGDVNWFREGLERDDIDLPSSVRRGADVLHQAIVDFRRIPYPVIAAINGPAAGAGFSLALMCDIRIASDAAFFAIAFFAFPAMIVHPQALNPGMVG